MFGKTTFDYTSSVTGLDSSLVDSAYYNANTRELAVDLQDRIYVYSEVPVGTYLALVNHHSPGSKFQEIKRNYGPGKRLGYFSSVNFSKAVDRTVIAPDMSSVGTPKAMTYASDATVTGNSTASHINVNPSTYVTLTSAPVVSGNNDSTFAVEFLVGNKVRTHTLKAKSFGEAEAALEEIAEMLDLEFDIKEIKVIE